MQIGLIVPLSGPWARQGQVMRIGAEMAVDDMNAKGGVAALGGAKLDLVVDLVGVTGAYLGRLPIVSNGSAMGDTDLRRTMSPALLEGVMPVVANWGAKGLEALSKEYVQRSREPWLTQNALAAYAHVWLLDEALEMAGKPERHAVNEALHKMDLADGVARLFPGGRVRFDARGRRIDAGLLVIQWQDGKPVTVYPPSAAVAAPRWPH